jgi:epoxyqueuosine reductase
MTTTSNLKEYIQKSSKELGFDKIGIAKAQEVNSISWDKFLLWLDKYSADMEWMHRYKDLRHDPRNILPSARSVIVVGMNYFVHEHKEGEYKIAKYAWGRNYHKVLKKKFNNLAELLNKKVENHEYRIFVDTGPVLEQYWAAEAGVGWIGKNSLILDKEIGSYMFLGVMLTNIALEPDKPLKDSCGECTLCIDSCPTDAIIEGRLINSSLCISYNTIENRAEKLPDDINLDGWVYGCDICQDVCPYNTYKAITSEPDFLGYK